MSDLKKEFVKSIKSITSEKRLSQVFFDFVELSAIAVANSVDKASFDKREERYMQIIGNYKQGEAEAFKRCFHMLVEIMSNGYGDYLGELYMSLDLGNEYLGQYFSPYDLSRLAAKMVLCEEQVRYQINTRGFFTLNEPTVGGGGMVIAAAQVISEIGFNPQKQMHVTCIDRDITAVHMTYLQLSLYGIPAVVVHGDTLRLEEYSHWHTPFHVPQGWPHKLERGYLLKPKEQTPIYEELIAKCDELTTPPTTPAPQLALF